MFRVRPYQLKSRNSKPGATEQPTSKVPEIGSDACQKPAGRTCQKESEVADSVTQIGGLPVPSQQWNRTPVPRYRDFVARRPACGHDFLVRSHLSPNFQTR
jgi:hypothetical protein